MIKKILAIISLLGLFLVSIQSASALQTYVGVKIINLTDDPSASCVGEYNTTVDPHQQGRIRALSSILPDYPIYFELKNASDSSLIWSGNSTEDVDYGIGDVIQIPQLLDLSIGQDYTLLMDIDAIRIYLPLENYDSFEATIDDNYWTVGGYYTDSYVSNYEKNTRSNSAGCSFDSIVNYVGNLYLISNNRSGDLSDISCLNDNIQYTCDELGFATITTSWSGDLSFKMNDKYKNLYTSTVGNINMAFTFN